MQNKTIRHCSWSGVFLLLVCALFASRAQANVLQIAVSGDGTVSDPAGGILCTAAGEPTCQFDSAQNDTTVNLSANPGPGFFFQGWGGDCASAGNNPTCNLLVNGFPGGLNGPVQNVTATFTPLSVDLTVVLTGSGQGMVQSDAANPGINCPGDCSEAYPTGAVVTLTAMPGSPTSVFTGWQGAGCTGTGACTVAMNMAQTVQANFEADTDGDGVFDPNDQCPGTPANEPVVSSGCSASQLDADGDGVSNVSDQCPRTPAGEPVDARGCSDSQLDDDADGVPNAGDECPGTPAGEAVDAVGCSASQTDVDGDGVPNASDQCPGTAAGDPVDAQGCSAAQLDVDGDGVPDTADQCPDTPAGEAVDAVGCSASQLDDDNDGVVNSLDLCPGTPANTSVNADGCSELQLTPDSDGDGVFDADDACPDTPAGAAVDASGCSEIQSFGEDLGGLPGLGVSQRLLGGRVDEICPRLIEQDAAGELTGPQRELRQACSELKNRDTTQAQATDALNEISLSQLPALHDYMVELTRSQFRHLRSRIREVKAGGGRGVSVTGLNIRLNNEQVPGQALQSAFEDLLGMGASEEAFADFGKLGIFLQGDIDDGDRDGSQSESGYDFDTWNLTLGADYRFTENFFGGGSISYGDVEVDYQNQRGSTDVDHWALSLYSVWQVTEHWYLDGMASYGESDFELERNIRYVDAGGSFESSHRGDTDGEQIFLGLNSGYTWNLGGWRFGPVASLTYLDGSIDGYTESTRQGSAAWNFKVDDRDIESLRFSAGLQLDYIFNTSFGVVVPGLRAAYVLENEDDDESINVRLANNPYAEATLSSDHIVVDVEARDDAFWDASFNLSTQLPMGISGFFSYQFYSAYDDFSRDAYTIGLRWDKPF